MKRSLSEWADDQKFSERSRPSRATLIRWAEKGHIPGAVFRYGRWWVDDEIEDLNRQAAEAVHSLPDKYNGVF